MAHVRSPTGWNDGGLVQTVSESNTGEHNALKFFGCYSSRGNGDGAIFNGDTDVTLVGWVIQFYDGYYGIRANNVQSLKWYGGYLEIDNTDSKWTVASVSGGGSNVSIDGLYANGATGVVPALDPNDKFHVPNVEYVDVASAIANVSSAASVVVDAATCTSVPNGTAVPTYTGDETVVRTSGGRYVAQDLAASGASTGDFVGDLGYHDGGRGRTVPPTGTGRRGGPR